MMDRFVLLCPSLVICVGCGSLKNGNNPDGGGDSAQGITVTGTIRGGTQGVTVRIVGKPAVTSGAGGSFTFTDVSPPYDSTRSAAPGSVRRPYPPYSISRD